MMISWVRLGFCAVASAVISPTPPKIVPRPPSKCEKEMNAWCNNKVNCPNPGGLKFALYDTNAHHDAPAWRCYDESTLDALHSKYIKGVNYCTREQDLQYFLNHDCQPPDTPQPPEPKSLAVVFKAGESGIPCIRIPSITMVGDGRLLAFAECRFRVGDGCEPKMTESFVTSAEYVCMKSSDDGGHSWSNISFPFGKNTTSSQPNVVFDSLTGNVILQNLMAGSNFQV